MAKRTRRERIEPRIAGTASAAPRAPARRTQQKRKPRRSRVSRLFRRLFYWSTVLGLWAMIGIVGVFAWYGAQMPSSRTWAIPERAPNIRILDRDGILLAHRGLGGQELPLAQISPWLPQAVIAIEDHRFRSHLGFDPIGFSRAMIRNVAGGRMREGGSTLTQQLAKNLFLTPERSIGRKVQELILSFWLEANYSKNEILELYLNRVYFGSGATGADAAARRYFGIPASRLNLRQAATLASVLKAPSRLSPKRNPALAAQRAELVLAAMQREGFITSEQRRNADSAEVVEAETANDSRHHVADMVAGEVKDLLGDIDRDLDVAVSIDSTWQRAATLALYSRIDTKGEAANVSEGALVALAPDGAIRALVGGRHYAKSQFNRAASARRQPGSAFKPFLWAETLADGYGRADAVSDAPFQTGKYRPKNYGDRYRGLITVEDALAYSSNVAAVRLVRHIGPKRLASAAARLGIASPLKPNASLALGSSEVTPLELTAAYTAFSNGGHRVFPYLVTRIADTEGRVLYERKPVVGPQVLDPQVAAEMRAMLRAVVARGTGKRAQLEGFSPGGKTGTSQNGRDAWFVGFAGAPDAGGATAGVWMGNDDASPTRTTGGGLAAETWARFMRVALTGVDPVDEIELPPAISRVPVPTARPSQHPNRAGPGRIRSLIDRLLGRS